MSNLNKIESISIQDAKEYAASDEQYIFCIDFLEISAHDYYADALVEELEDAFDAKLAEVA